MEEVQPVQPHPPKRADAGEGNEKRIQSKLQRQPFPVFTYGQGYFMHGSQRWRKVRLTSYMNSLRMWDSISSLMRTTGEWDKNGHRKSSAKALWITSPAPLASVQATAEEISVMGHCHILGSGQRPLSVLHGSWTSLLSSTVSLPSWWTLLSWAYLRILTGQNSLLHCSLGNIICSD